MSIRDLLIKAEYRSLGDDIVNEFYIPVLREAIVYKRAVGFFSSSALIEISRGISGLVKNGGKIMVIASPYLSEEDLEAIRKGYELRNLIIQKALIRQLKGSKNQFEEDRLNLLANLISNGILDIKIAFTENKDNLGIYHEKMGIISDVFENKIAFAGSMNESATAMTLNYEAIDVFCSWKGEKNRVQIKENAFNSIWNNSEPNVRIMEFPNLKQEIIDRYKKGVPNLDIDKQEFGENKGKKYLLSKIGIGAAIPNGVKLYDYQIQAIDEWEKQNFRGIFDMATGTGKTFTCLGGIVRLLEKKGNSLAVIIVCPYQHLVEQWVEDIVKFNINPIIGYSASCQKDWKRRLEDAIRDQKLKVRNRDFFCFICTNATFSTEFVQKQINKIRGNTLLVVDEAHNFGAGYISGLLSEKFTFRLALSATFERHNDEQGTAKLYSYFGNKCIEYSLERAIKEKRLTPYKYYPVIVTLSDVELQKYLELTYEIGKCIIKDINGKKILSERGKKLALARARLVAGAEEKIIKLEKCIKPYLDEKHILVYCGATKILGETQDFTTVENVDLKQIDVITDLLGNKLNMKVSQFTSKEKIEEREILKDEFAKGDNLQALIAIKCLDEGVNIPKVKTAFILASTTNPKEYIQRRGRVLRLAEGKKYAEIYDFITLPRLLDDVTSLTLEQRKRELTLVKNELYRAKEFARLAINMVEAEFILDEIKKAYSLEDNMIMFEEEFEYGQY